MTDPQTPATEAGRALLDCDECYGIPIRFDSLVAAILAIETEARAGSWDKGYTKGAVDGFVKGRADEPEPTTEAGRRDRLATVLTEWGIDALTSDPPHGWRCEYPESYGQGPCDCVKRLLDDLEAASL